MVNDYAAALKRRRGQAPFWGASAVSGRSGAWADAGAQALRIANRANQRVPVDGVEGVLDQQAEVGLALHQQASAEEQGVRVFFAQRQGDEVTRAGGMVSQARRDRPRAEAPRPA